MTVTGVLMLVLDRTVPGVGYDVVAVGADDPEALAAEVAERI